MKTRLIVIVSLVTIIVHIWIAIPNILRPELSRVKNAIPSGASIAIAEGDTFAVILVNKESEYGSDDEKADKIKLSAMLGALLRVSKEQLSNDRIR